jgi:outer membrane protein insertion porin family
VQERPTGELQLSAGFSNIERFIFSASVRQRNFRGRGQEIRLSANVSSFARSVEAGFTEPYLGGRNLALGIDVFRRDFRSFRFTGNNTRDTTYTQVSTGFQIRSGFSITEFWAASLRYGLSREQIGLDQAIFFSNGVCDPLRAGRFLCDVIGTRLSSIVGLSLNYNSLNSRIRPTRGKTVSLSAEFAGLGGDVRYTRFRGRAQQFWNVGNSGFIFSLLAEGGTIIPLRDRPGAGVDDIFLNDRFFLGEPQIRGFAIRGVGPRILTQQSVLEGGRPAVDANGNIVFVTERRQVRDDAIGGRNYYLGRAEIEIPLGTGARELGLRPSIWADVGALWGVEAPVLTVNPAGDPITNENGQPLYQIPGTNDVTINPTQPDGSLNVRLAQPGTNIRELFLGNSASPRITAGIGVNWNSPFGPFRIDFAQTIRKVEGDDERRFTFNVGTQF